jgi:uncharacterized protein
VSRFVQAFFANLKEIKGRRPKWRDFDVSASVAGWTRFPAAEQWLTNAGLPPEPDKRPAYLDPKERKALFRDFAEYQKTHEPALFREFAEYQRTHEPMMMVAYHGTGGDH